MNESCGWLRFLQPQALRVTFLSFLSSLSLSCATSRKLSLFESHAVLVYLKAFVREVREKVFCGEKRRKQKCGTFLVKPQDPCHPAIQNFIYYSINFKLSEAVNSVIVVIFN